MIRDVFLSAVFIGCQLLLVAALFGIFLPHRPAPAQPGKLRSRAKDFAFLAAATVVITTGLVDIASAVAQRQAVGRRLQATVIGAALGGRPLIVHFDEGACLRWNLGTIECGVDYRARYQPAARRWVVTGYNRGEKGVITASADSADGAGWLSVWGAGFRFDKSGIVYREGERAGTIRMQRSKP